MTGRAEETVCVFTTSDETAAEVVRIALEQHGIPSFVENQHQGGYSGVLPVRVYVLESRAAAAQELLTDLDLNS